VNNAARCFFTTAIFLNGKSLAIMRRTQLEAISGRGIGEITAIRRVAGWQCFEFPSEVGQIEIFVKEILDSLPLIHKGLPVHGA